MRYHALVLVLTMVIARPVAGQDATTRSDREDDRAKLRALKPVFEKAASENQIDLLKPHLHDPFSAVTYTNREFTDFETFKARWQKTRDEVVGPRGSYKVTLRHEPAVFFDDVAVVRGDSDNFLVTSDGNEYRFNSHWTGVCRKVDGEWKILRMHFSLDPFGNPMVVGAVKRRLTQVGIATAAGGLIVGALVAWVIRGRLQRRAPAPQTVGGTP